MHWRSRIGLTGVLLLVGAFAFVPAGAAEKSPEPEDSDSTTQAPRIVAYYFHGNLRCATCRKLEAYSEEAITKGFEKELDSRTMEWRAVNTDEPENQHFVQDFELVAKALVLVEYQDGNVTRFSNLRLVWQLIGDKDGFLKYVRDSTSKFLEQS